MNRLFTATFSLASVIGGLSGLTSSIVFAADAAAGDKLTSAFQKADADHNQQLTLEEYQASSGDQRVLKRNFLVFDFDKNEKLSFDEFAAIPGLVPAAHRGPLPDIFGTLVDQAFAAMDESYNNWDQRPQVKIPVSTFVQNFTASLSPDSRPVYDRAMMETVDENGDQQVSREEAQRFLEIQIGLRGPKGHWLHEQNGRVANLLNFRWVDANSNDAVDQKEFNARWVKSDGWEKTFKRGDLNGDSRITYDEFLNPDWIGYLDPVDAFLKADTDLDGLVSKEELSASVGSYQEMLPAMMFPSMDDDGDGKLSLNEYRFCMLGNRLADWHAIPTDSSRNRSLEFEEFKFKYASCQLLTLLYFHRFDTDGDGKLSHEEYAFIRREPNAFHYVNLDGSDLHQIYINHDIPNCGSPDVSSDGKQILFDGFPTPPGIGGSRIFLMNIDGKNAINLCDGLMPIWSPDGKQFACSRYGNRSGVWIMNIDGSHEKHIADGWGAQWSPDGKMVGFSKSGGFSVYDVVTGEIREVLPKAKNPFTGGFWNMNWSPDSQRFAFRGVKQNGTVLASIKMTGEDPDLQVHFETSGTFDQDINWSPDGDHILISMRPEGGKYRRIHIVDLNSKEPPKQVPGFEDANLDCFCAVYTRDGKGLIVGTIERN